MKLKILASVCAVFAMLFVVEAQNMLVGKVTNFENEPLTNVRIFLDNNEALAAVNSRGFFQVEVPAETKEINLYSPVYGLLSTPYSGESRLSFVFLDPKHDQGAEDVAKVDVGYGEMDKEDVAYNVEKLKSKNTEDNQNFADIYDLIRGRLTGVTVTDSNRILIRGVSTIWANPDPLFVVNGTIVYNIDYIRPIDVAEISVLKGAAASIYGSRGANGVIQITLRN